MQGICLWNKFLTCKIFPSFLVEWWTHWVDSNWLLWMRLVFIETKNANNLYKLRQFYAKTALQMHKKLKQDSYNLKFHFAIFIRFIFHSQLVTQERRLSTTASRTMAAMSLGFIVLVTPWTIQEVVAACTGSRAPASLDFLATWLALSNSFWNPFLYWLLNNHFRRISKELLLSRVSVIHLHKFYT